MHKEGVKVASFLCAKGKSRQPTILRWFEFLTEQNSSGKRFSMVENPRLLPLLFQNAVSLLNLPFAGQNNAAFGEGESRDVTVHIPGGCALKFALGRQNLGQLTTSSPDLGTSQQSLCTRGGICPVFACQGGNWACLPFQAGLSAQTSKILAGNASGCLQTPE